MNKIPKRNSNGQILVIVTLMLVGLMAMLAFVLDGGNVYSQRRQAQLAADAGALAGARAHCDADVDEAPAVAANNYVTLNDAILKSFSMGPGENEVTVETMITFDTFFLHLLGRPELTAEAIAAAKCETGGGASVLPVAWSCRPPKIGDPPGEDCDLSLDNLDSECNYPDNPDGKPPDTFYIIIDSADLDEVIHCAENDFPEYGQEEGWGDFTCYDCDPLDLDEEDYDLKYDYCHSDYPKCDVNCDGDSDLEILSEGSFGWMDLDGGGSDANELKQWVLGENDPFVEIHKWYAGKSGVAATVFDTVADNLLYDNVVVPVFDHFCSKEFGVPGDDNDDCEWHDDEPEEEVIYSGIADDYFHIIGFANYLITCVEQGPHGPCTMNEELVAQGLLKKNTKTIEGCFIRGVTPDIVDAGGGADFDAYTLVLSR